MNDQLVKVTNQTYLRLASMFFTIAIISGCASTQGNTDVPLIGQNGSEVASTNNQGPLVADSGLSQRQRMSKILGSLERGQSRIAEVELNEYLRLAPNNQRARSFLRQLRTEANSYYPAAFFTVTLRSGQSLSTLSKQYLGTPWEFYALAKYNNIENPSRVNIGSRINIPKTSFANAERARLESLKTTSSEQDTAPSDTALTQSSKPSLAAETLSTDPAKITSAVQDSPPVSKELTPDELVEAIQAANDDKDFERANKLVTLLLKEGSDNSSANALAVKTYTLQAQDITTTNPQQASMLLSNAANIQLSEGQTLSAFNSYKAATQADPDNALAQSRMLELQNQITQNYHRQASISFRQQALDDAIAKWDIVLSVDPDHANALAYRTQAVELKQRLEALQQ